MATVKFLGTTLTAKGMFTKGDSSNLFTEDEAKDLQRLSTVESPEPTTVKKKAPTKKKKVKKDDVQESTEK